MQNRLGLIGTAGALAQLSVEPHARAPSRGPAQPFQGGEITPISALRKTFPDISDPSRFATGPACECPLYRGFKQRRCPAENLPLRERPDRGERSRKQNNAEHPEEDQKRGVAVDKNEGHEQCQDDEVHQAQEQRHEPPGFTGRLSVWRRPRCRPRSRHGRIRFRLR